MAPSARPMLQNTELTENWSAVASDTRAERPRGVEVVDALAVDRAVAGIDEGRGRRVLARIERGRRRHDLEGRARRVEPLGGAVEQRRGRRAVGPDLLDPAEVLLDVVRVVARRRDHHPHAARARVERDDGTAVAAERVERGALAVDVERRHDGVADDRLPVQLVERLVDERREAPGRARQDRVQRALEPRPRAGRGRVPDDVRREPPLRVAAEVERAARRPASPCSGRGRGRERGSGRA